MIDDLISDLLSNKCEQQKFILGTNMYACHLAKNINFDAFVDDTLAQLSFIDRPVITSDKIPKGSLVVNTVNNSRAAETVERLRNLGAIVIDNAVLADIRPDIAMQILEITQSREIVSSNKGFYHKVEHLFHEEKSKQIFNAIYSYRVIGSISALNDFRYSMTENQYFEDFLNLKDGEVFVDGGGYDGHTTITFTKHCKSYGKVFFFEPTFKMMALSRKRLLNLKAINFIQKGLYKCHDVMYIDSDLGPAARMTGDKTSLKQERIEVESLDDIISEPVTFIKLDIEGFELDALLGMRRQIMLNKPKLAISVYHDFAHFLAIPELILSFRSDYKIYLRHYTSGWAETIMFFV
jgi:FkbM family methyltransferase